MPDKSEEENVISFVGVRINHPTIEIGGLIEVFTVRPPFIYEGNSIKEGSTFDLYRKLLESWAHLDEMPVVPAEEEKEAKSLFHHVAQYDPGVGITGDITGGDFLTTQRTYKSVDELAESYSFLVPLVEGQPEMVGEPICVNRFIVYEQSTVDKLDKIGVLTYSRQIPQGLRMEYRGNPEHLRPYVRDTIVEPNCLLTAVKE